jgi:hypothetical protein
MRRGQASRACGKRDVEFESGPVTAGSRKIFKKFGECGVTAGKLDRLVCRGGGIAGGRKGKEGNEYV